MKKCKAEKCENNIHSKGLCNKHYQEEWKQNKKVLSELSDVFISTINETFPEKEEILSLLARKCPKKEIAKYYGITLDQLKSLCDHLGIGLSSKACYWEGEKEKIHKMIYEDFMAIRDIAKKYNVSRRAIEAQKRLWKWQLPKKKSVKVALKKLPDRFGTKEYWLNLIDTEKTPTLIQLRKLTGLSQYLIKMILENLDLWNDFYNLSDAERFMKSVRLPESEGGCWEWTGNINPNGRPTFCNNGKSTYAYRFSYENFVDEIPKGYNICHKCDNPLCVNPNHLWAGTQKANLEDSCIKGRFVRSVTRKKIVGVHTKTGEIKKWPTQNAASRDIGVSPTSIASQLNGILKTVKGWKFESVN